MNTKLQVKKGGSGQAHIVGAGADGALLRLGGYMTLWGHRDAGKDRALPGSTARAIREYKGKTLPFLWSHEGKVLPLGSAQLVTEDKTGCLVSLLVADTRAGRDVKALLEQTGQPSGLSYSYDCKSKQVRLPDGSYGRDLVEIYPIGEVSLCTFPMLAVARITSLASKSVVADRLLIAETEARLSANETLTSHELRRYAQASERELDRGLFAGRTEAEHTAHYLGLLRHELAEVSKL